MKNSNVTNYDEGFGLGLELKGDADVSPTGEDKIGYSTDSSGPNPGGNTASGSKVSTVMTRADNVTSSSNQTKKAIETATATNEQPKAENVTISSKSLFYEVRVVFLLFCA